MLTGRGVWLKCRHQEDFYLSLPSALPGRRQLKWGILSLKSGNWARVLPISHAYSCSFLGYPWSGLFFSSKGIDEAGSPGFQITLQTTQGEGTNLQNTIWSSYSPETHGRPTGWRPNSRVCPFNLQETRFPSTRPLLPSASQSPCRRYQRTSSHDPMHCSPQAPCSRDSLGENTGVGCRALLLDPGIGARSPDCRRVLYRPRHQGSATETPQARSTRTGEHAAGWSLTLTASVSAPATRPPHLSGPPLTWRPPPAFLARGLAWSPSWVEGLPADLTPGASLCAWRPRSPIPFLSGRRAVSPRGEPGGPGRLLRPHSQPGIRDHEERESNLDAGTLSTTPRLRKVVVAQPCPTPYDPMNCPENSLDKKTGVGCHFFLQGILLTQGLNLGLLHCRQVLYHL